MPGIPTLDDVRRARLLSSGIVRHTPLMRSKQLSLLTGVDVILKAENLQRTGSFKIRGAANKLVSLSDKQRGRGVITASAGNHAQGVALAAQELGVQCTVVMPKEASIAKVKATSGYGAQIILHGDRLDQALQYGKGLAEKRGLTFVHPFDDSAIIAGQGTIGFEICEDEESLNLIVVPVGGGGLIAGIALVVKQISPRTQIVGVQAESFSAAARSFRRRRNVPVVGSHTLADGIAVTKPGKLPMRMIRRYVDDIVTVREDAIAHAQLLLLERAKLVVEGAGAVGLAAFLQGSLQAPGKRTVIVLSGGNIDINLVNRILVDGLTDAGRYLVVEVVLQDTGDNMCDDGAGNCTLRAAIEQANATVGTDTIAFFIPTTDPGFNATTTAFTIQPTSGLPTITDPVIIDGYTQPGASPNTNGPGLGLNTVLKIELDGTNVGGGAAILHITAGNSAVRGLVINRFGDLTVFSGGIILAHISQISRVGAS